jgi:hypothetical protein
MLMRRPLIAAKEGSLTRQVTEEVVT